MARLVYIGTTGDGPVFGEIGDWAGDFLMGKVVRRKIVLESGVHYVHPNNAPFAETFQLCPTCFGSGPTYHEWSENYGPHPDDPDRQDQIQDFYEFAECEKCQGTARLIKGCFNCARSLAPIWNIQARKRMTGPGIRATLAITGTNN